jgi:multicomponent Na+:H+ antiporter subunit G
METFLQIFTIVAVVVATCFSVIGVLGYFRLPDAYTRLHASGMVSIFGVVLLLVAATVLTPVNWGHALVLILFLLAAGPATAHAVGSAAKRIHLPMKGAHRDDLARATESTLKQPPAQNKSQHRYPAGKEFPRL